MPATTRVYTFTLKGKGIIFNRIHTPVHIAKPSSIADFNNATKIEIQGIWDTGATNTVITQKVIDALKLTPTGMTTVNTASEEGRQAQTYVIDLYLNPQLRFSGLQVTEGKISNNIDCLIGMDIMNHGDFSITNFNGKTTMSFRLPSLHEIDYLAAHSPNVADKKLERNDPCPCGSGKKYKKCHGLQTK